MAAGWCLAAALLTAAPLAAQDRPPSGPSGASPQAVVGATPAAGWAALGCDAPQDFGEAVVCVQRRMARATEGLVLLGLVSAVLGGAAAAAMLWALFQIRHAMQAAADAASAARDSVDAIPALERAYVFVEINARSQAGIEAAVSDNAAAPSPLARRRRTSSAPTVEYQIANHGRTPAIVTRIEIALTSGATAPPRDARGHGAATEIVLKSDDVYPKPAPVRVPAVIGGGEEAGGAYRGAAECELTKDAAEAILAGTGFLWLHGRVTYEDVFRREHETAFCWRYAGAPPSLEPYGGSERNYRT